jgi:hypothetical protein
VFDLDREIAAWSTAVHDGRCRSAEEAAELRDHLYCEVERAHAEGLSEEDAFHAAIARLGSATQLQAEHAKNRSLFGTVCRAIARYDGLVANPEHRRLLIANALIWASLQFSSALIVSGQDLPKAYGWLSIGVIPPLWWASDRLLRAAMRRSGGAAR